MPSRPILMRVTLAVVLIVALVALADGAARHELRQAIGGTTAAVTDGRPADAHDDE